MIVKPKNWEQVGQPITLYQIEKAIVSTLSKIDCNCLSFSGGIDSSLLLYYMIKLGMKPRVFTTACSLNHPDLYYAHLAIDYFKKEFNIEITETQYVDDEVTGDDLVKSFYKTLEHYTDSIIAGDGIDELLCGYYGHQENPDEATYFKYLRELFPKHLKPLDDNSGAVKVYLPYLDEKVTRLLWQIPLSDKVSRIERKKIMMGLAKGKVPDEVIRRKKYGFCTAP